MFPIKRRGCTSILMLSVLLLATAVAAHDGQVHAVTFTPFDTSHISFYTGALYRPQLCPKSITFGARARFLPELSDGKLGLWTSDVLMDGEPCTSSTSTLLFSPIGKPDHLPPQWVFEDSAITGQPVNFTCGASSYAIRYGYLNDVQTPSGFLDDSVVYLDFAVIPNTQPFAFCSYATRRSDGDRPVNYEPFPSVQTWNQVREAQNLPPLAEDDGADEEEMMMAMASAEPVPSPEEVQSAPAVPMLLFPSPEAMVRSSVGARVMEAVVGAMRLSRVRL